jgi:hypothetical protein
MHGNGSAEQASAVLPIPVPVPVPSFSYRLVLFSTLRLDFRKFKDSPLLVQSLNYRFIEKQK